MDDNLSPRQFEPEYGDGLYHGTHHPLHGDTIKPASKVGHGINWEGMSNPSVAYATEDEDSAWSLASVAHQNHLVQSPKSPQARTRVHRLEPNETMRVGMYHPDHPQFGEYTDENLAEWVSPRGFKVKDTLDIKEGQQGTFPHLNWAQFSTKPTYGYGDPFNHPLDEHIEYGHKGAFQEGKEYKFRWGQEMQGEEKTKVIEDQIKDPKQGRLF